ncbi:MAG TPA: hypothetical protein VF192_05240 [Longimicrobiales bacterium]
MRKTGTARGLVAAGCLALVLAACASGGNGGGARTDPGRALAVRVTNDLVPPAQITVWIVSEMGSRRRLGTVQPDQKGEFSYVPVSPGLQHRLIAEAVDGREVTSDPFIPEGVAAVSWGPNLRAVRLDLGTTQSR